MCDEHVAQLAGVLTVSRPEARRVVAGREGDPIAHRECRHAVGLCYLLGDPSVAKRFAAWRVPQIIPVHEDDATHAERRLQEVAHNGVERQMPRLLSAADVVDRDVEDYQVASNRHVRINTRKIKL